MGRLTHQIRAITVVVVVVVILVVVVVILVVVVYFIIVSIFLYNVLYVALENKACNNMKC